MSFGQGCLSGRGLCVTDDKGTVGLLGISAGLKITRGRVVGFHGLRGDPRQARVRRYRGVGLVQVGVDQRIAREAENHGAVGEEIDVLRANDMHALQRRFPFGSAYG